MIPTLANFASTTNEACSLKDIISHERLILRHLNWDINLPNFSTWINSSTVNWDIFLDNIERFASDISMNINNLKNFKFRNQTPQSFNLFRSLTQYIDIICLDVDYLYYNEKYLVISVIFLLIFKSFGLLDFSQIPFLQMGELEKYYEVVLIFSRFLNNFYNVEFVNIFDHIQYVSCYMESK